MGMFDNLRNMWSSARDSFYRMIDIVPAGEMSTKRAIDDVLRSNEATMEYAAQRALRKWLSKNPAHERDLRSVLRSGSRYTTQNLHDIFEKLRHIDSEEKKKSQERAASAMQAETPPSLVVESSPQQFISQSVTIPDQPSVDRNAVQTFAVDFVSDVLSRAQQASVAAQKAKEEAKKQAEKMKLAATKIQAVVRGKAARNQAQAMKDEVAAKKAEAEAIRVAKEAEEAARIAREAFLTKIEVAKEQLVDRALIRFCRNVDVTEYRKQLINEIHVDPDQDIRTQLSQVNKVVQRMVVRDEILRVSEDKARLDFHKSSNDWKDFARANGSDLDKFVLQELPKKPWLSIANNFQLIKSLHNQELSRHEEGVKRILEEDDRKPRASGPVERFPYLESDDLKPAGNYRAKKSYSKEEIEARPVSLEQEKERLRLEILRVSYDLTNDETKNWVEKEWIALWDQFADHAKEVVREINNIDEEHFKKESDALLQKVRTPEFQIAIRGLRMAGIAAENLGKVSEEVAVATAEGARKAAKVATSAANQAFGMMRGFIAKSTAQAPQAPSETPAKRNDEGRGIEQ